MGTLALCGRPEAGVTGQGRMARPRGPRVRGLDAKSASSSLEFSGAQHCSRRLHREQEIRTQA